MSLTTMMSVSAEHVSAVSVLLLLAIGYVMAVSMLRFSRRDNMQAQFGYSDRESLAKMPVETAQKIQHSLFTLEFPFTTQKALEFALFKTYGIPTISGLLTKTTQLSSSSSASKRVEDTRVITLEIILQDPTSTRSLSALARMNYIHSLYQKSGLISNEDLLYTLALFALEPIRWIAKYEWRELTDMERCAIGVFWKGVGDGMKIDYGCLPSGTPGWKDGLDWLAEVESWSMSYEARSMVPNITNKQTADETTKILLWRLPARLRGFGLQAVSALMDDRLRSAMMYKPPHFIVKKMVKGALSVRRVVLRYLALPRPSFLRVDPISDPDRNGRMHKTSWDSEPWYVSESLYNRWGPLAWIDWLGGRPIPGDAAGLYKPEGFTIGEVGPSSMTNKGSKECERDIEVMRSQFNRGCPMAFAKNRE